MSDSATSSTSTSKTSEESSLKAVASALWKRYAASATGLWSKYRSDPFFRTEVNVVLLQVAFALVILGLVGTSFSLLYHDVSVAIVEGIRASLASNAPSALGPVIVQQIQQIRAENLIVIASVIALTTVLFGYIIARIVLSPARAALASQKQFIGNIAHELRTPLSVIKTNTEVALLGSGVSRDLRDMMMSNVEELDRISAIINNLLSLSALITPEQMRFSAIDLSALVQEIADRMGALARRNGQTINVKIAPHEMVRGNKAGLTQIIENILRNAIAYTPKGGSITIGSGSDDEKLIGLTITDSGIGIAQKDLVRIFEPFYRAESSRTRGSRIAGSGLGLAIVSELVKMHHGRISVRSKINEGTTVTVFLPRAIETDAAAEAQQRKERTDEVGIDFSRV